MKKIYSKNFFKTSSLLMGLYFCLFVFTINFFTFSLFAEDQDYWSSYQETNFTEGDGTSSSPYVITTPGQLYYFLSQKNGYAKLGTSIDLSAHLWNSPQRYGSSITLDGNGYAITNLKSTSAAAGLIGVSNTTKSIITIKNLTISVNISYNGNLISYTGAFVGGAVGSVILNKCVAYGSISNTSNSSYTGGMVGTATSVTAKQCINYININGKAQYAGGIIGYVSNSAIFDTCGNNGTIESTRTSESLVGGIVGQVATVSSLSKCYNAQSLTSSKGYVGGLIGEQTGSTNYTISSVYNTGVITGEYAGGFIGQSNGKVTISYAYNSANVNSTINSSPQYETIVLDADVNNQQFVLNSGYYIQTKSVSNNNLAQQYETGGGYLGLYEQIKSVEYVIDMPNTSIINNIEQLNSNSTNVYTVKPNSFDASNIYNFNFVLHFNVADPNYQISTNFTLDRRTFKSQKFLAFNAAEETGDGMYQNPNHDCDGYWLNDDEFLVEIIKSQISDYNYVVCIYMLGIEVVKTQNTLSFSPLLFFSYRAKGYYEYGYKVIYLPFSDYGTYSYTLPDIPDAPTFYSVNQIKTAELGENFVVDGKINNGLPYLKDFYWQNA